MQVRYGTQTIKFEVQRSKKVNNSYITVERESGVLVKVPEYLSDSEIQKLVKVKAKWIMLKLEELGNVVDYGEVITGSRLYYLGKSYYVELVTQEKEDIEIVFSHSRFKIYTPFEIDQIKINKAIDTFYKTKAETKITKLIKKYSDIMKLFPEHVSFKKSKTKWGSCSERNRISFNPEIMKLSSSLIEYAVIHELSHIAYKNHSKEFWSLVKKFMSDYLKKEEELRVFEKKL